MSLAQIPPEGASVTLRAWPFAAVGQQISIIVEGLENTSETTIKYQVLDRHVVTEAQAIAGIVEGQALIAKAEFLSRIRLGRHLTVKAYVSFDNGGTWNGEATLDPGVQQFRWLKPTLVA